MCSNNFLKKFKNDYKSELKKINSDYRLIFSRSKIIVILILIVIILSAIPVHYFFSETIEEGLQFLIILPAGLLLIIFLLLPVIERVFVPLFILLLELVYMLIEKISKNKNY
jgi:hypothetical protein